MRRIDGFRARHTTGVRVVLHDQSSPEMLAGLRDRSLHLALLSRILGRRIKRLRFAEECDSRMSLIAAIESGKGIAIVIASMAHMAGRRLRFVPLSPPAALRAHIGAAWIEDALTPSAAKFLDAVRSTRGASALAAKP